MKTSCLFFQLLKTGCGHLDDLSHTPSHVEWQEIYESANKQALLGITFACMKRLSTSHPERLDGLSPNLKMKWLAMATCIQKRNDVMNQRCEELQRMLSSQGVRSTVFKGQANLPYYLLGSSPEMALLRQSGDIDVWIEGGKKRVIQLVQQLAPTKEIRETHAQFHIFKDVEVEAHYRPGLIRDFCKNAKLQRFFSKHAEECFSHRMMIVSSDKEYLICTPTWTFDAVLQLTHIFHHFFTEGVGLRQCLDYYFVLSFGKKNDEQIEEVRQIVSSLHLSRFASALMWLLGEVFGLEKKNMLWSPCEKDGRFLLEEIMQSGNFGRYDERHDFDKMNLVQSFYRIFFKNLSYLRFAPFDWFWSPLWRLWHFINRKTCGFA